MKNIFCRIIIWIFLTLTFIKTNFIVLNKKNIKEEQQKNNRNKIYVSAQRDHPKNLNEKGNSIYLSEDANKSENYLSDILQKQSGVTLKRYGGPGSFSELSIRGSYSHQTNIYIDGILMNNALGAGVNLEEFPIDLFSKVEIYPSYIPTHLLGNNLGGAVDLIPQFSTDKTKNLFFKTFAHSLYGGGLGIGLVDKNQIHFAYLEGSLNQYRYLDDNGTKLINSRDDKMKKRENEDYLQGSYTSFFRIPIAEKNIKVFINYFGKERGLPGPLNFKLHKARYDIHRLIIKPSIDYAISSQIFLNILAGFVGQYSYLDDPDNELFFFKSKRKRYSLNNQVALRPTFFLFSERLIIHSSFTYAFHKLYLNEQTLGQRMKVEFGTSAKYIPFSWLGYLSVGGKYLYIPDTPGKVYQNILFIQPDLNIKHNHLFGGSIRAGIYPLNIFNKIRKNKKKKDLLEFFMMISHAERTPSLSEAYGDGSFLLPNSKLNNENSITYTTGLFKKKDYKIVTYSFDISYFYTQSRNLIILISNSRRSAKYFNISASYSHGIEFDLKFFYSTYFLIDIKASYLRAIDNSDLTFYRGKFLPFKPIYIITGYLEGGYQRLQSFLNFTWRGQVYRDRFNQKRSLIPNQFFLDIGLIYYFQKNRNYSILFKVKNILGNFVSDILNYPLPGRYFELRCTGKLEFEGGKI